MARNRTDPVATAPVDADAQGSLFGFDNSASAEPAKQERVVQEQDKGGTDYAAHHFD